MNINDLVYAMIGIVTSYITFKLNDKKSDAENVQKQRDYIVLQNDRLNRENKELRKEIDLLRKELLKENDKHNY